jgi:hypothetical protein
MNEWILAGEALQLHVRASQGNFKQLVQRSNTHCVSPCHDLFTGLVVQLGARSLGIPEFSPAAGQRHTQLELPASPLPWSGSDSLLPITQEAASCCLLRALGAETVCSKGRCRLQGNKIRGGAWAQSCSDGGRGGSGASTHNTAMKATQPLMLVLSQEPRGQNKDRMAEIRDAERHPQGWTA